MLPLQCSTYIAQQGVQKKPDQKKTYRECEWGIVPQAYVHRTWYKAKPAIIFYPQQYADRRLR